MDLVDEEDVALTQIGEGSDQVAGFLECGSGSVADVDAELARNELGESGLAEARWAEEKRVVERLTARERGVNVDAQRLLHAVLADELGQALGAEGELDNALVRDDFRSGYFGAGHKYKSVVRSGVLLTGE